MASDGDTITYTYSDAKETEDISAIDEITIQRMDGSDGRTDERVGGSGGLIQNATADVSAYDTLEIWVGGLGFGRSNAGGGSAGGSTELWTDSNTVFIAAADGGGGGGDTTPDVGFGTSASGGDGGGRGGLGGTATGADSTTDGEDAEGVGFGGDGGDADFNASIEEDGGDGGQELGIASGGTTTTGGSADGRGEITLSFTSFDLGFTIGGTPVTDMTIDGDPVTGLSIDGDTVF